MRDIESDSGFPPLVSKEKPPYAIQMTHSTMPSSMAALMTFWSTCSTQPQSGAEPGQVQEPVCGMIGKKSAEARAEGKVRGWRMKGRRARAPYARLFG